MLSLLQTILMYLAVGFAEWAIALQRTKYVAQERRVPLILIVFVENVLNLFVLQRLVSSNDWYIIIAYSAGASIGALMVSRKIKK